MTGLPTFLSAGRLPTDAVGTQHIPSCSPRALPTPATAVRPIRIVREAYVEKSRRWTARARRNTNAICSELGDTPCTS